MVPDGSGGSPAPIDRPILEFLRSHLAATAQVEDARITHEGGRLELRVALAPSYYPASVDGATLSIRWYANDDFAIHYREAHAEGARECRWDHHPNPHNDRDHFHPPPDAATPGEDADWPGDHRDVLAVVLDHVEGRIADLWAE